MSKKKKNWSWSTGTRPFTIRVTESKAGGNLYVVRIRNGRQVMRSLGHRDKKLAKRKAEEISKELAKGFLDQESDFGHQLLRIGELMEAYEAHGIIGCSESYRKEQPRKIRRVADFFGHNRKILSLSESDVHRYSEARLRGNTSDGKAVRLGTVWSELTALKIACRWATRRKLLRKNPLADISIPQERSPRRPVASEKRYLALKEIAPAFNPMFSLALDLAWATGHRIGAILHLRWDDVDFNESETAPHGSIRWRQEHDKTKNEHVVPMNRLASEALSQARRETPGIGKSWIFPAPRNPSKPLSRRLSLQWLRLAEERADLDRIKGAGWHAFRRAWATLRKEFPLKDVAAAGGWRDTTSLLRAYMHSDSIPHPLPHSESGSISERDCRLHGRT